MPSNIDTFCNHAMCDIALWQVHYAGLDGCFDTWEDPAFLSPEVLEAWEAKKDQQLFERVVSNGGSYEDDYKPVASSGEYLAYCGKSLEVGMAGLLEKILLDTFERDDCRRPVFKLAVFQEMFDGMYKGCGCKFMGGNVKSKLVVRYSAPTDDNGDAANISVQPAGNGRVSLEPNDNPPQPTNLDLNVSDGDETDEDVEISVHNLPARDNVDEIEVEEQEDEESGTRTKVVRKRRPREELTVKNEKRYLEVTWNTPEEVAKLFGRNYCDPEITRVRRDGCSTKWYRLKRGLTAQYHGSVLKFTDLHIECFNSFVNFSGKMVREAPCFNRPIQVVTRRKRANPDLPR